MAIGVAKSFQENVCDEMNPFDEVCDAMTDGMESIWCG
jgi:hypothetical protein